MSTRRTDLKDTVLPARRREEVLRRVNEAGQVTVAELAGLFDVSADTIRRDIDHLAESGLLARTHGGAVPATTLATSDSPVAQRMNTRSSVKTLIGEAAAELIQDGETVLLNGGTTTLATAAALGPRRDLTVVTNNLLVPTVLPTETLRDLYIVGGTVRSSAMTSVGPFAFAGAPGSESYAISADVAVIGVGGMSVESGLSTSHMAEAQMMRRMMDAARRLVIVADATKADHNAFVRLCPLDRVGWLVTDLLDSHPVTAAIREAGGQVVRVG